MKLLNEFKNEIKEGIKDRYPQIIEDKESYRASSRKYNIGYWESKQLARYYGLVPKMKQLKNRLKRIKFTRPVAEISRQTGISQPTLINYKKSLGLSTKRARTIELNEKFKGLDLSLSNDELMKLTNLSRRTVHYYKSWRLFGSENKEKKEHYLKNFPMVANPKFSHRQCALQYGWKSLGMSIRISKILGVRRPKHRPCQTRKAAKTRKLNNSNK